MSHLINDRILPHSTMNPAELAAVVSIGLFVGMLLCLEMGYRIGGRALKKTETAHEGTGTIGAAVFALLGLLLGLLSPTEFRIWISAVS